MLNVLEEQRSTAILDAFRTGTLAHALSAYDPYERYLRFLTEANPPRIHETLDVAERARARGFLEESRIRQAISTVQERLRAAEGRSRSPRGRPRARRTGAREASAHVARRTFIAGRSAYPTLLATKGVQAALRPEEIVVTFFLAEPHSFRWVMSKEHLVLDRIAGGAIESARLGGLLFEGISTADDRPMVVVPHGVMHYVPFEVLTLQNRMVIERHAVSYASSLNALVQLRNTPANTAPFRVLAIGNPAIAGAPAATERGNVEKLALLGPPLPFAEQELHAIGRTFRDRTRILRARARANQAFAIRACRSTP